MNLVKPISQEPLHASTRDNVYLNLLKGVLTASIYEESAWRLIDGPMPHEKSVTAAIKRAVVSFLRKRGIRLVRIQKLDLNLRNQGLDWPLFGLTMAGTRRLDNIQNCIQTISDDNIEGDFVETGVWRGGSSIWAKAVLESLGDKTRNIWCCDSFEGMPKPKEADLAIDAKTDFSEIDYLSVDVERVRDNFRRFDLLDDRVRFLKGWFCDTLPTAPIEKIAILRMDGDLYESTMDSLNNLYAKVSKGGFIIVDDYNSWSGCHKAVDEFRSKHGITDQIIEIDAHAVYWRKS